MCRCFLDFFESDIVGFKEVFKICSDLVFMSLGSRRSLRVPEGERAGKRSSSCGYVICYVAFLNHASVSGYPFQAMS
jgi:hypothetical protein